MRHEHWHRHRYARRGGRYAREVVLWALGLLHVVALGGTLIALLYIPMSLGTFAWLAIASQLLFSLPTMVAWRVARSRVAALQTWLDGRRNAATGEAAWRAGLALPLVVPLHRRTLAAAALGAIAWDTLATLVLGLAWPTAVVFFAGSAMVYVYWLLLAFLSIEHGLRPILEDVSRVLPDGVVLATTRLSLRRRLAAALPAINIITGVVVGGFFPAGSGTAASLGLAIGAATLVALTVSLWLTGLLADSVVVPISALRDAAIQVGQGDLATRVPVAGSDETAELAVAFNEMVRGLQQRERLHDAFGAFVDPALAERVQESGADLSGEQLEASIMFIDVRGFTAYAEEAEAHEVVGRLNDLYACVVPIVLEHGGHANKFVGDGLLAVFGAPDRLPDHADRAASAAVAIAAEVWEQWRGSLRIGIGVNTGTVVAGTIGGGGRLDFTVIGDVVNTAARVEAATREVGVDALITEATWQELSRADEWEPRGALELKGKRVPVRVFAHRGESGAEHSTGDACPP